MSLDLRVELCVDGSPTHRRSLQELQFAGLSVPAGWHPDDGSVGAYGERRIWVRLVNSTVPLGFLLRVSRSRRVPWARIAHVDHLGDPYFVQHAQLMGKFLREGVEQVGRVMRLEVRVLHREAAVRDELAAALIKQGAHVVQSPAMYRDTQVLEVTGTSTGMFAKLPGVARRNIRQPINHGLLLKTNAVQPRDLPRLLGLMEAAFARTGAGGPQMREKWARDLACAVRHPEHWPLITLEHADRSEDANRIVAFALGAYNGDHITYNHGASDRTAGLGSLSLGYAPVWALMEWGIDRGVRWIDLGGISTSPHPSDPLFGITTFKRNFGGKDAIVADELSLTVNARNVQLEKKLGMWLHR